MAALERALAEEREEGKQRLHRLRLELTGSASEQLAAQQARALRYLVITLEQPRRSLALTPTLTLNPKP